MDRHKDTFIQSISFDTVSKNPCQFTECPKYGWLTLMMGFDSEETATVNWQVCAEHMHEMYSDWVKTYLPKILDSITQADKKEWNL